MPIRSPTTSFSRRAPRRTGRDTILIVCEGARTEPNYFEDMIRELGLSSADIRVCGEECGSDPVSVVKYAIAECENNSGAYEEVLCVVDRDGHPNFAQALDISRRSPAGGKQIQFLVSDPCFEYWILLHFEYTSRPYVAGGGVSRGALCLRDVKRHFPDYEKGSRGVYREFALKASGMPSSERRGVSLRPTERGILIRRPKRTLLLNG